MAPKRMTDDPIMDALLADYPPEERDDPEFRAMMSGTLMYQAAKLNAALMDSGRVGKRMARKYRRKMESILGPKPHWWNP